MNKLFCCDNVVGMKTHVADQSIPLVVTSPPWDDVHEYGGHFWDFEEVARQLWRVITPGGVVCWHVGDQLVDGCETLTSFKQALFFQSLGFKVNTLVIDVYSAGKTRRRYGVRPVQYVFCCSKGSPAVFNPRRNVPNKHAGEINSFTNNRNGVRKYSYALVQDFRCRNAVWKVNNGCHTEKDLASQHPAPANERLFHDLIYSYSLPCQIVLDCFNGQGTTTAVAFQMGRRYLGFEIDPLNHNLAVERMARTIAKSL